MKKIIIFLGIIGLIFTSCKDYIEEENLSSVNAADFYSSSKGFESLVNANYSYLREIYGNDAFLFCDGTDLYAIGCDPGVIEIATYSELNPSTDGVEQLYNNCYEAIQIANMALFYSDKTESYSDLNKRIGEIKYLRANAYFLLVQTYGGVSLVTNYIAEPELAFDRSTADQIYEFIIVELEDALNAVDAGSYTGRVNKRAVQHLLAKVHLTRGYESYGAADDFSKAAAYADAAIGGQTLTIPFEELWTPGNEGNEEVVFSVQFDPSSIATDPTGLGHKQCNYFSSYLGGSEVAGDAPYRTYNLCPTQFTIDLFTQDDERWAASFMVELYDRYYDYYDVEDHSGLSVRDYYVPKWMTSVELDAYIAAHPEATIHPYGEYVPSVSRSTDYATIPLKKFDDPKSAFGGNGDGRVGTRDIILSRLGDTYLLAAEAYLKAGSPGPAVDRINEVRQRAGVADITTSDLDIDFILDERGRELLGEYHRWFDLKRTGKLVERASAHNYMIEASNFNGANGELKILRPIPQEAIDLNQNKDFSQNPAYN
ncbi:RagB/SusD family nutrient uptake outer membrane protein [Sunxiuqinia indica]|uniref:RagB/SusD family nutrient uptake outer membrane protein n=1 Tax=Sunxiuqinia indica TaxID=2692584 RepID=UPI0013599F04|nr:RagB/SusD family nutrient uptake outer membrane protein [Sunxiuqinia indica]